MVAGWDNLLPAWFARLHKRYRTPVNSILFVGMVTLAFSLASLIGVKEQEAFQIQDNAATVFYALMYMVLFAIPLIAIKRFGVRTPLWLKIASASGFIVSVIALFYTMIPITTVDHPGWFAAKIIAVVVIANGIGIGLYFLGRKRAGDSAVALR
jgi:amino acid transporter